MRANRVKHKSIVVVPQNAELFKRNVSNGVMVQGWVVDTEREELGDQDSVFLKIRKGKYTTRALLSDCIG